jgi:hypothetical protein
MLTQDVTISVRYDIRPLWVIALVLWQFIAPTQAIEVGDTASDFTLDAGLYRVADDDQGGTEWDPTEIGAIPPIHPTTS